MDKPPGAERSMLAIGFVNENRHRLVTVSLEIRQALLRASF
jgi:hypothetical protein